MFKPRSTMSRDSAGKVGMAGGDLNCGALTVSGGLFHTDVRAELGWGGFRGWTQLQMLARDFPCGLDFLSMWQPQGWWDFSPGSFQELAPEVTWFPSYMIVHKRLVGGEIKECVMLFFKSPWSMMDNMVVAQSCSEVTLELQVSYLDLTHPKLSVGSLSKHPWSVLFCSRTQDDGRWLEP